MKREEGLNRKSAFGQFAGNKRGQVTIFIILAIIVVSLTLLIYSFYPQIKSGLGFEEKNPQTFIQSCIEDEITKSVVTLSSQGGSLIPEHYVLYNDEKIEYLCYINENYQTCVVQQPLLKEHIESEVKTNIQDDVAQCFDSLEETYSQKGYSVVLKKGETNVELLPQRIVSTFNYSMSLTKGENSESYDSFKVVLNNNLYELVSIANSIIEWEATYGTAETTVYMDYYHNLKVEKNEQSDGTTIYVLTDRNSGNKFKFASRSVAWPPGYGK